MEPAALVGVREGPREDIGQGHDLALVSGLLGELAQDGDIGRLAEFEAAAGERPDLARHHRRRDPAQEDPAVVIADERIRRDPGPLRLAHGARSDAR